MVSGRRHPDRGQLILVGAVLVAVTILGSITLLNAIHESPQIATQQDTQSLLETEWTLEQVRDDLEALFLYNGSANRTGPVPYARGGEFGGIVDAYNRQYATLAATDAAGVTLIEFNRSGSLTGGIARQNRTQFGGYPSYPANTTTIVGNAETIPSLSLYVNETDASGFRVQIESVATANDSVINITDSGVTVAGEPCPLSDPEAIEVAFRNGTGEVSAGDTYCENREFGTDLLPPLNVTFENVDSSDRGIYAITGSGNVTSSVPNSSDRWFREGTDYVVNPKFEIEYRSPDVTYSSTLALYNTTGQ